MRTLALALWIMSLVIVLGTVGSAANKFDKNFVIHYSFDKGNGDQVKDIGGEGNHGELMNGAKREFKREFKRAEGVPPSKLNGPTANHRPQDVGDYDVDI